MYNLCSENKGADQLRGYREADLRLCFRICKSRFSRDAAHIALQVKVNSHLSMTDQSSADKTEKNNTKMDVDLTNDEDDEDDDGVMEVPTFGEDKKMD